MSILKTISIFAKFWEKGKVKTRLAKTVGDSAAAEIYWHFLRATTNLLTDWPGRRVIGYSPESKQREFSEFAPDWELIPQVDNIDGATTNLGDRIRLFFETVFNSESTPSEIDHRVVLIGSDTPQITIEIIDEAFEKLEHCDVVIGPSLDGGYYLIGARNQTPRIFNDISWSSERVFEQTIRQLDHNGYRYLELHPIADVDDEEDLRQLVTDLENYSSMHDARLNPDLDSLLQVARKTLATSKMFQTGSKIADEGPDAGSSERKQL